jgi:hypothetical protein
MQIVNGYMCQTSCDVSAAKAGHDPKNPHDDPVKARRLDEQKALSSGKPTDAPADASAGSGFAVDAVSFGGRLSGLSVPRGSAPVSQLLDRVA